ncbi:MAG TPA: rhomboid family intramembrane serine protease [Caulobacterales bacterium]|nr:rhomboid family intramembrane serine protease [Caulobacterales bacterium]
MSDVQYERRPHIPFVVWLLALAMVASFGLTGQYDPDGHQWVYYQFGIFSERFYPSSPDHYQSIDQAIAPILGHMFVHFGWPHIIMNMIAYLQAAPFVAHRIGGARFLLLFLLSGLGSAAGFILLAPHAGPAVGASGAICGVFGAYFLAVRPTPQAALADPQVRNAMLTFLGVNVLLFAFLPIGIAWQAHLGGFIVGALVYPLLAPRWRPSGPWG